MISKKFIDQLLSAVDIVDIVGKYVKLKSAGNNYKGLCPFHKEKTPSFTVSRTKQFYHCFGCGAHGNAIDFLMENQGIGFVKAVDILASDAGISVVYEEDDNIKEDFSRLHLVLEKVSNAYKDQLKKSQVAIDYLKSRGMKGDIARDFNIGFAPNSKDFLKSIVANYEDKDLELAGVVVAADKKNNRRDLFKNRIIFPIKNINGNIIGFGGRVIDNSEPKYLNSPETPLFEKSKELYGLYESQKTIRATGVAIVVEGYMDVISLHQHGVKNVVASMGTATTSYQVQRLLRLADSIIFCFDGDSAGVKAASKAAEALLPQLLDGKKIGFIFLPAGMDPDDFIQKNGKSSFDNLISKAETLTSFLLRNLSIGADLKTPEGRIAFIHKTREIAIQLKKNAPSISNLFRKEVGSMTNLSIEEINDVYSSHSLIKNKSSSLVSVDTLKSKKILLCIISNPSIAKKLPIDTLDLKGLSDEAVAVINWACSHNDVGCASVSHYFNGTPYAEAISSAQADLMRLQNFNEEAELDSILKDIRRQSLLNEQIKLASKFESSGLSDDDKKRYLEISREISELMR